jgi:hypothetical protein
LGGVSLSFLTPNTTPAQRGRDSEKRDRRETRWMMQIGEPVADRLYLKWIMKVVVVVQAATKMMATKAYQKPVLFY